jgi:hypothetical protein
VDKIQRSPPFPVILSEAEGSSWGNGCIAVGNLAIDEIWTSVDDGTPVEIRANADN